MSIRPVPGISPGRPVEETEVSAESQITITALTFLAFEMEKSEFPAR